MIKIVQSSASAFKKLIQDNPKTTGSLAVATLIMAIIAASLLIIEITMGLDRFSGLLRDRLIKPLGHDLTKGDFNAGEVLLITLGGFFGIALVGLATYALFSRHKVATDGHESEESESDSDQDASWLISNSETEKFPHNADTIQDLKTLLLNPQISSDCEG